MNASGSIPRLRADNLVAITRVISEQQEETAESEKKS